MGLRAKINVLVLIVSLLIIGALGITASVREELINNELSRATVTGTQSLWDSIVTGHVQRLVDRESVARNDRRLREALAAEEPLAVELAARALYSRLVEMDALTRLDVVGRDGEVLYSSLPAIQQDVILGDRALRQMLETRSGGSGVGNDSSRNVAVVHAFPVLDAAGDLLGLVAYSRDMNSVLEEFRAGTDAEALIVNRRNRLLEGTRPDIWPALQDDLVLQEGRTVAAQADDRVYSVINLPLTADLGTLVAYLVVLRDTTEASLESRRLSLLSLGAIGLFLMAALTFLSFYLHRLLKPLAACTEILNALTRGETHLTVAVEGEQGRDEVAQIARAINIFRRQTLQVQRQRRLQERQRRRQERFIRHEMTRLAGTLSRGARADVLEDLKQVEQQARVMGGGSKADAVDRADGLQLMGLAFERMTSRVAEQQERLSRLVADLQSALATKSEYIQLRHELDVAKRVQQSFLPGDSFKRDGVRIRAFMKAAKDVGGDFYDFFEIDDNRIGVVIADVAGKGVPAALFMAVSRTLIRANAGIGAVTPGQCLEAVNNMLVESSREEIFVTVFYGVFDRSTGVLTYANGGHNPPCIVHDGKVEVLPLTGGVVLSMFGGLRYRENSVRIPAGGKLYLFTDGVNEAVNTKLEEFGDDRLHQALLDSCSLGPGDTVEEILRRVEGFAGEADQADDITMLTLGWGAPQDRRTVRRITLSNDLSELRSLVRELGGFAESAGIPQAELSRFELVLDEVFTNIVSYAFPEGGRHEIDVVLDHLEGQVEFTVEDSGSKYDVLANAPGKESAEGALTDRAIGGLGVYLVQKIMDEVEYRRIRNRNRLVMRKTLETS